MDTAARVYVAAMGAIGYLLGQLFFGSFSVAATLTGPGGVGAAAFGQRGWRSRRGIVLSVAILSTFALSGFLLETCRYYRYFDGPGNDFAWELRAPYLAAVTWLGADSLRRLEGCARYVKTCHFATRSVQSGYTVGIINLRAPVLARSESSGPRFRKTCHWME